MAHDVRLSANLVVLHSTDLEESRTVEIPFASHKHAVIAQQTIGVDAELQPQAVKRTLTVKDDVLVA